MRAAMVVMVMAVLAASAQAGLVLSHNVTGTYGGLLRIEVWSMGQVTVMAGPMETYLIKLGTPEGAARITALELGIVGHLYQQGTPSDSKAPDWLTPDMYNAQHLYHPEKDSHFLLNAAGNAWGDGNSFASETNDFSVGHNAVEGVDEGYGTLGVPVTFITPAYQSQQLDLAWLVLLPHQAAYFQHGPPGGFANGIGEKFAVDGLMMPEPVTLAVLAAGGPALLRRRRSR